MRKLIVGIVLAALAAVAVAQTVSYRNTAAASKAQRVVLQGYEIASVDPGSAGTLAVGPLDLAGFSAVEAWIENVGTATSGSCATYAVADGDDHLADFVNVNGTTTVSEWTQYVSTTGKVALGSGFTVAAGATSFAASVGQTNGATGYVVQTLPRRIAIVCNAATNARPKITIHAR